MALPLSNTVTTNKPGSGIVPGRVLGQSPGAPTGPNPPSQDPTSTSGPQAQPYFLPPIDVIQTWNTKRLLPNTLLSQYTPFATLFLIDDRSKNLSSSNTQQGLYDSIVLGGPTDTILGLDQQYFADPSAYAAYSGNSNNIIASTQYVQSTIQDGTFKLGFIKGIRAKIYGYCGDDVVNLIPLTLKLSQLVHPEGKGIMEISRISVSTMGEQGANGYIQGSVSLICTDITQMFSFKSVISQVFSEWQKYLLVFGWQGPVIDSLDLSSIGNEVGASNIVISGANSLKITLLDGTDYELHLPSPIVRPDGVLNLQTDKNDSGLFYIFDTDDIDHGNRMVVPIFSGPPIINIQYPKATIDFQLTSAGAGFQFNKPLSVIVGGADFSALRTKVVQRLNSDLTPIAWYYFSSFFDTDPSHDAETNQALAQSFYNNISTAQGAGELIKALSTNPIEVVDNPPAADPQQAQQTPQFQPPIVDQLATPPSTTHLSADQALPIIEKYESGGQNILQQVVSPSISTASGYYQITDTTWRATAPKVGVNINQYPTAMSSPKDVQTQVATQLYNDQGFEPWSSNTALIKAVSNTKPTVTTNNTPPKQQIATPPISVISPQATRATQVSSTDIKVKKYAAAYRLGDVITACVDVFDELLDDSVNNGPGSINGIITILEKAHTTIDFKGNPKFSVRDLQFSDVYDKDNNLQPSWIEMLNKNNLKDVFKSADLVGAQNLIANSCYRKIAEILGYVIISQDGKDLNGKNFIKLLNHFKAISAGNKITDVNLRLTRSEFMHPDIVNKIFCWDPVYEQTFTGSIIDPISVADIPISVDTLTRILQGLVFAKSANNLVDQILTSTSLDYGFSLRCFRKISGQFDQEISKKDVQLDNENPRSAQNRNMTGPPAPMSSDNNKSKINIVIDDEFLTNSNLTKLIRTQLDNLQSPIVDFSGGGVANQWNVLQPNVVSKDSSTKDFIDMQQKIITNEYSSAKLNSNFIIDIISSSSLIKTINFSTMGGQESTRASQFFYGKMYHDITSVNGMFNPLNLPEGRKDIAENFNSIHNRITANIIEKYKMMPGKADFEIKYLQIISEIYQQIAADKKIQNDDLIDNTTLMSINTIRDSVLDKDSRNEFVRQLVSQYLYNRPIGTKYAVYMGHCTATLHGTIGLGMYQGLYIRGAIEANSGIYGINRVTHNLELNGNGTFYTDIDTVIMETTTQNQSQKILNSFYNQTVSQ